MKLLTLMNSDFNNHQAQTMKPLKLTTVALVLVALLAGRTLAQSFNSGSDGSLGALNVTTDTTLAMPTNGIFNYTTITIASGKTLRFTRNALNTPVYLLATGDVVINGGTINLDGAPGTSGFGGAGGPGGFDGGKPGVAGAPPGAGYGPGGGKGGSANGDVSAAGSGSYGAVGTGPSTNKGAIYGNALLMPLVGGSGGGGMASSTLGVGGGGGGGAILIASNTKIQNVNSQVRAFGGDAGGGFGYGSGGAIRLVAPTVEFSSGYLYVGGGGFGSPGGAGRIRVDAIDLILPSIVYVLPNSVATFGALMAVFPNPLPRLDVVEAAGTTISEGNPGPVSIVLPINSDTNRTVTVQARDFNRIVPITVLLTPDSGDPVAFSASIDNSSVNPAQTVVPVTLPTNTRTTVSAWRR